MDLDDNEIESLIDALSEWVTAPIKNSQLASIMFSTECSSKEVAISYFEKSREKANTESSQRERAATKLKAKLYEFQESKQLNKFTEKS